MNYLNLKIINQIIERDSKDTTYKFALLKGTIELIQDYHHFLTIKKDVVEIPLGLLVEKWMFYYYPIISSNLKQKKGEKEAGFTISFRKTFREVIKHYTNIGGFSVFYNEYMNDLIPNNIKPNVLKLISELRKTLINLPMRYIGNSYFKKNYSIFHPHNNSSRIKDVNRKTIIENSGTFSIPKDFYKSFYYLGSILTGQDSLLLKWADFTVKLYKDQTVSHKEVLDLLLTTPTDKRKVEDVKRLYSEYKKNLFCTWSSEKLNSINIDHLFPFSVYKNNDLWNLVPSKPNVNRIKSDKIPDCKLLLKQKDLIIFNWEIVHSRFNERFLKEVQISLIGKNDLSKNNWKNLAFNSLLEKSNYLINIRGYDSWYI